MQPLQYVDYIISYLQNVIHKTVLINVFLNKLLFCKDKVSLLYHQYEQNKRVM